MSVCDKRCEGCQYPDCVNDAMDLDDYREADARDRALGTVRKAKDPPPVGGDAAKKEAARERAKAREYNKAHRAELREYYKKWRAEHPGAQKEYYRKNRERELAKARAYREAHRAEINARARERYRVKQEASREMMNDKETKMDKYYIVRGDRSGVFFGQVAARNGQEVELRNVRKLWYWDGACAVEQIAVDGVTAPANCKFTVVVPEMTITDAIQIVPCSERAVEALSGVRVWKR